MSRSSDAFNRTRFSHFLNSPAGRVVRGIIGLGFLAVGFAFRGHTLGVLSMAWSFFPLSAGALDICYMSALLGGPLSGPKIRAGYKTG